MGAGRDADPTKKGPEKVAFFGMVQGERI